MSSAVLVKTLFGFIGRAIENDGVTRVDCFGPSLCLLESTANTTTTTATTCYATKELHEKPLARRIINPLAEKERSKREMTRNHSEDVTLLFNNYRPFSTLIISKELFEVDSIISRYFCLLRCRYCYFPFWSREYRGSIQNEYGDEKGLGSSRVSIFLGILKRYALNKQNLPFSQAIGIIKVNFVFHGDCSISLFIM